MLSSVHSQEVPPGTALGPRRSEPRKPFAPNAEDPDNPLLIRIRPTSEPSAPTIRLVDLFSGCGGLTLGVAQAAWQLAARLEIPLAVDFDATATKVYLANFPESRAKVGLVEEYFDGDLGTPPTDTEESTRVLCGEVDILVGGPPCQGHSNLNNHTRRDDVKNALYSRMVRAAEILRPQILIVENVPAVQHDKKNVVAASEAHLEALGYSVSSGVVGLHALGVAQTRRRHVLIATSREDLDPDFILRSLSSRIADASTNLRWAIGDLEDVPDPKPFDIASTPSAENVRRMALLLQRDLYDLPNEERPKCHQGRHSYVSMYGRLRWDRPAQTITSGFGSIGQGRYMHPSRARTITAHEAARLQGFPDYFSFDDVALRGARATMIANAVPPPLGREIAKMALPAVLAGNREFGIDQN